jgi:hypothetical protein
MRIFDKMFEFRNRGLPKTWVIHSKDLLGRKQFFEVMSMR